MRKMNQTEIKELFVLLDEMELDACKVQNILKAMRTPEGKGIRQIEYAINHYRSWLYNKIKGEMRK